MKKRPSSFLLLPAILLAYALMYVATTKPMPCNDACVKTGEVAQRLMDGSRPYVAFAGQCYPDSFFCVGVRDSTASNWVRFSDTVCQYLQAVSLPGMTVVVTDNRNQDTLIKRRCP